MEKQVVYGVDLSGEVTPAMARDAIIECFKESGEETLDHMGADRDWKSEKERESFQYEATKKIIRSAFEKTGGSFDSPSKSDLIKAIGYLAEFVAPFRDPEIIRRNYEAIGKLIEKIGK